MNTFLIVGLGNFPQEYHKTRHNVGFMVIDRLCKNLQLTLAPNKFNGESVKVQVDDKQFVVAKPHTYMNLSGDFVRDICNFYKIPYTNVLVIHDDADSAIGTLKIRYNGSSGGQNGIKDIINKIGTDQFNRIKIGIGRPTNKSIPLADYVLSTFKQEEWTKLNPIIDKSCEAIMDYMNGETISFIMNKYNSNNF